MSDINTQFKAYEDRINSFVDENFNSSINRILVRLEKKMIVLQNDFFTILAQKIIGAKGAPKLGAYTPSWKPLSDNYTEEREFNMGVPENEFFNYSGKLGAKLSELNATTFFGKPLVLYTRGGFKQKPMQKYTKPDPSKFKGNQKAMITIDLFPKISGSIGSVDEADLFRGIKVTDKRGRKSKTSPIAYRLKNFQGNSDRPVVVSYMKWWLNIKALNLVRRITK